VAVENLARIAGQTARSTLRRFVEDPASGVRSALARGVGRLGQDWALALLKPLVTDRDRGVRLAAISALGRVGHATDETLRMVRTALQDPYIGIRLAAVLTLADLQGPQARPRLRQLAGTDDLIPALQAATRLARMGEDQPVLDAIARALVDRQWTVRAAGCNAGSSLHGANPVARKLISDRGLVDPEPRVRIAAARAVLALGDSSRAARSAALLQGLACRQTSESMESLCLQAAEVLLRANNRVGLRQLERLVRQGISPSHRREALRIALTGGGLLQLAVDALADSDLRVAVAAAVELYRRTTD